MKDNNELQELIVELKRQGNLQKSKLWRRIADDLSKPTRIRRIVNLYKIDELAKDDEIVIVPGKVLGTGEITRKISIAAYNFSSQAVEKLKAKNCKVMTIAEIISENPQGKKVRILG
jgi:large subunit ribosomal protein L18e